MAGGGKYRWRTALRRRLPWRFGIYLLVRKGKRDCGDHEWYRHDDEIMRCYHCEPGRRPVTDQVW